VSLQRCIVPELREVWLSASSRGVAFDGGGKDFKGERLSRGGKGGQGDEVQDVLLHHPAMTEGSADAGASLSVPWHLGYCCFWRRGRL